MSPAAMRKARKVQKSADRQPRPSERPLRTEKTNEQSAGKRISRDLESNIPGDTKETSWWGRNKK